MISAIRIEGYRCFQRFEMDGLGRINLLVGTNNSGKSSILEALHLLTSRGHPAAMLRVLRHRGESSGAEAEPQGVRRSELSHLFSGHEIQEGSQFSVHSFAGGGRTLLPLLAGEVQISIQRTESLGGVVFREGEEPLEVQIDGTPIPPIRSIPLDAMAPQWPGLKTRQNGNPPSRLITTESVTANDLVSQWDRIALTNEESMVLAALRILDPGVERLAAIRSAPTGTRGGFIIKLKGHSQPVPIGSLGEGIWRMLSLDDIDPADPITVQRIEPSRDRAIPYNEDEIREAALREIEVR